ncbi:MAG: VWA domain-containing protein [Actinomycetota bacterium]
MTVTDAVLTLSAELRSSGVPVSVSETEDALRSLLEVPIEDRTLVRAALSAALVKDPAGRPVFTRLFDILFPVTRAPREERAIPEELEVRERLARAVKDMDEEALRDIAEQLVEEEAGVDPDARVSDEHYRYRALRGLDLQDLTKRLVDEDVAGKGRSALERRLIEEDFADRMERFSEEIADAIRSQRRQGLNVGQQIEQQRREPPENVDFLWAKDSDIESMRAALYPLSRRLALRLSNKRRHSRRGRLDLRRTIRRSLSTGGVMLEPRFRRPSSGKPELWVLCDISGSMRSFARFTLELVYALSTQFERVRSFAFIDGLDEITDKFETTQTLLRALERIDLEADVVALDGQSWYGNSLAQFWQRYEKELSPRATVLVLGDARNNFRTTGADLLYEIKRKARHVWWLNPEPRTYWGSADSVADEFEPNTDAMVECRNLQQLEAFVVKAL